jgi:hypothetical protein
VTAIELDPMRVDASRVRRQHLADPAASIEQVATDLVGIQAQVLSSAYLSIDIRTKGGHPDKIAEALAQRRLVRAWGMRGTLHLYAADHFPAVAAALGTRTGWRRPVWFRYFGVTDAEMDRLNQVVGEVLDDGVPPTRAELAAAVTPHLRPTVAAHLKGSWGTLFARRPGSPLPRWRFAHWRHVRAAGPLAFRLAQCGPRRGSPRGGSRVPRRIRPGNQRGGRPLVGSRGQ